jgi:hypothetical protein
MSTELLDATTLEEDCFTTSLLLDFGVALEEDAFTALLLDSSFLTEELLLSPPTELEEFLETSPLLELVSSQSSLSPSQWRGSGETEEEDSSPHAMKIHAKTSANTNRPKMDCFALTGLAMTFVKIFTENLQ